MVNMFEFDNKELARLFLGEMLEKLPSTKSGKGFFIGKENLNFIVDQMALQFSYLFFPFYEKQCVHCKNEKVIPKYQFINGLRCIFRFHFCLLPQAGFFTGGYHIENSLKFKQLLDSILLDLEAYGMLGNSIDLLQMLKVLHILYSDAGDSVGAKKETSAGAQ